MNRMEITGPGADYQIQMKKLLAGDAAVSRVEANKAYYNASSFGNQLQESGQKAAMQNLRWMDRYLLSLSDIKETDTITLCGSLDSEYLTGHCLGDIPIRPSYDLMMLHKQGELIAEGTGLELKEYIDLTTRIKHYALRIPFEIQNSCIDVELDVQENSYIITIDELTFKKQCNEAIKKFLSWWDSNMWQNVSPDILFLKRFCELKSDRIKNEEKKRATIERTQEKLEHTKEWEARTLEYVRQVNWNTVEIGLNFSMLDPMGAAVELSLSNLPETELYADGILIPKKIHFAELDQGIIIEHQLDYFPEEFKTRLLCAMVKYLNEIYKEKQPDFYEYKKWHMICERRDFTMKFSKRFTYYSDEKLGIVQKKGVSFAEWGKAMVPGEYADLYQEE